MVLVEPFVHVIFARVSLDRDAEHDDGADGSSYGMAGIVTLPLAVLPRRYSEV